MCQNRINQVTALLEGYTDMRRKIAVLRYELEHPATVSPDEMIEALSFARGDGEGHSSGHISNKTLYIAMNYQAEAARHSSETMDEIARCLIPLEREANRLEHYLNLLPERDKIILRKHYIEGATWEEVADACGIARRTAHTALKTAIGRLAELYEIIPLSK